MISIEGSAVKDQQGEGSIVRFEEGHFGYFDLASLISQAADPVEIIVKLLGVLRINLGLLTRTRPHLRYCVFADSRSAFRI